MRTTRSRRHGVTALALAAIALVCPGYACTSTSTCEAHFDASFVQIRVDQLTFDATRWQEDLAVLQGIGVRLVVLQFTGDEHGPYDGRAGHAPVAALLDAASQLGMDVVLGLSRDPAWPSDAAVEGAAPPLCDRDAARTLGVLCTRSPACIGWYIPQEIEDQTWSAPARLHALRGYLARTAQTLHALTPGRLVMIAPFFSGSLDPVAYAAWSSTVIAATGIDVVILQDGVGTGRATAELAGRYLACLGPALAPIGVRLWSVAELFHQVHGPPRDDQPFEAVPTDPAALRHSLAIEALLVDRIVAFSVLNYMDPRRAGTSRQLYQDYAVHHRAAATSGGSPCQ
jgi:hypothetical protein